MKSSRYDINIGRGSNSLRNGILLLLGLITIGFVLLLVHTHNRSPLPSAIDKKVDFVVFLPTGDWSVKNSSFSYIKSDGVLQFEAANKTSHIKVSFSEQTAPSQFNDIPQYYPALRDKLNSYDSAGTANGIVYLTKPTELKGETEVIFNSNGTLLFAHPSNNLPKASWQKMFNNMRVVK